MGLSMFIPEYLRRVVRPIEHLDHLGAGRVKISQRAANALERSRKTLRVPKLLFMAFGGFMIVTLVPLWITSRRLWRPMRPLRW